LDAQKVLAELQQQYPGAAIKQLPEDNPSEIVCEFDPGEKHPDWSLAVAVIDKSEPHFHRRMVEVYRIMRGQLNLHINDEELIMYEGQEYTITPGIIHWAEGNETWVEVYCAPAYNPEDHHLYKADA
jgi:mannose-6-phosphate isomerase-like protein (cupin superfamily)